MWFQPITDFIFINDKPREADVIFVPGGNYPDAAIHAAELYHAGFAPYVLPSGRYSIVKGFFEPESIEEDQKKGVPSGKFETEWEYLRTVLMSKGVPSDAILKEDQATFTWENAIYSRKVLKEKEIKPQRALLACQAFHARRCLLYYQQQFPDLEILVCPTVTKGISRENWFHTEKGIDTVLGEMERCGGQFHEIMRQYIPH